MKYLAKYNYFSDLAMVEFEINKRSAKFRVLQDISLKYYALYSKGAK